MTQGAEDAPSNVNAAGQGRYAGLAGTADDHAAKRILVLGCMRTICALPRPPQSSVRRPWPQPGLEARSSESSGESPGPAGALCFRSPLGCGYHTAGHAVTLPDNVRTIAVPAFVNQTANLQDRTDADRCRRAGIGHAYSLSVINQANDDADATLRGTVLSHLRPRPSPTIRRLDAQPVLWL